jgi:hypothetical protein
LVRRHFEWLKINHGDPARRSRNQSNEWPQKGTRGTKKKPNHYEMGFPLFAAIPQASGLLQTPGQTSGLLQRHRSK